MAKKSPKSHKSYKVTRDGIRSAMSEIEKNINKVVANINIGTKEAMNDIAEEISDRSLEIAPVDTGELVNSHYIVDEETPTSYTIEVGYKADHAVFAHTNANRGHDYKDPTTPNTHWNFLLNPAQDVEADIERIVAESIKKTLGD